MEEPFSESQICNIHQLILKNIDNDNAGRYGLQNVLISGATTTPPDYILLNHDKLHLPVLSMHGPITQMVA